tara:strand:- start:221 stop:601 length:381 start_codon:yes stop_codon:yes gene_type:complete
MTVTSAKYFKAKGDSENTCIIAVINGQELSVPLNTNNTDYIQIQKWVSEGNTIKAADNALTWEDIRGTRDEILRSTDWTMITGASVDQSAWATYRQAIRDIPQTYKDKTPDDVVWPTQPSTKGPNS